MKNTLRGMSLIDVMIGAVLFLIVFIALATLLRTSVMLSTVTKAKTGADTLLQEQMEYIRSLSYAQVGTVGGTPSGILQGTATTTLNTVVYTTQTSVAYVDDTHDGSGLSDANHVTADYKSVEITVEYDVHGIHTEKLVGTVVPPHVESNEDGGTILIHVVNAQGTGVSGASVHITNSGVTPAFDVTDFSNAKGLVSFASVPAGTGYQVSIIETGYSSAQTYLRTTLDPHPLHGQLTVVKDETTSDTFTIDTLANVTIHTLAADLSPQMNVPLALSGVRTIGASSAGVPLYEDTENVTTDMSGAVTLSLPWDIYTIVPSGFTIASSNQVLPLEVLPGGSVDLTLIGTP